MLRPIPSTSSANMTGNVGNGIGSGGTGNGNGNGIGTGTGTTNVNVNGNGNASTAPLPNPKRSSIRLASPTSPKASNSTYFGTSTGTAAASNARLRASLALPLPQQTQTHTTLNDNNNKDVITYIFPDYRAVQYFQRDFISANEFHIVEETRESGFDIYLVEQWVNNRNIGSIVSTFTGNSGSTVAVTKFTVIKKLSRYYPKRFQEYLNELMINRAKVKVVDSSHGSEVLFVTNLTTLPSNLNPIPIECGDPRSVEGVYAINSNFKKLNCSGRSLSLVVDKISVTNEDKFRQMYKIYNVKIPIKFAIRELVNLVQTCLFYFDLLDAKYCDGFLCNKTEEAIINWWNLIGLPHFNTPKPNPKNGVLPPRTIAAIISFTISIKLRLQLVGGCDPPKDPFDFENFMISVGQFQKQYKLDKRRKLDLDTLNKLFTLTNNNPNTNINPGNHYLGTDAAGHDYHEEVYDFSTPSPQSNPRYNLGSHPLSSTSTTNINQLVPGMSSGGNIGLSSYRKNKNYYSKEIKKITNVVRNTVQDHIGAVNNYKSVNDEVIPNSTKANGARRVKKLSELNPVEIETLDLELLVKNFLIGKRLIRLWYGAMNPSVDQKREGILKPIGYPNVNNHHSHHAHDLETKAYRFISLKEEIGSTRSTIGARGSRSEFSRYSRGINKMKLGLQGRGKDDPLVKHQLLEVGSQNHMDPDMVNSTTLVDELLGVGDDETSPTKTLPNIGQYDGNGNDGGVDPSNGDSRSQNVDSEANRLEVFYFGLNRRNSFPMSVQNGETNLNVIEFEKSFAEKEVKNMDQKSKKKQNQQKQHRQRMNESLHLSVTESSVSTSSFSSLSVPRLPRSNSFSCVEDFINSTQSNPPLETAEILSHRFVRTISKFSDLQTERKSISLGGSGSNEQQVKKSYAQLNLELIKLSNVHSSMQQKKTKIVDEDLLGNLDFKINDLTLTIDRLIYETRIVVKRINELEESSNLLESNLKDQCSDKLSQMIDALIILERFESTYSDINERRDIIVKLTGSENPPALQKQKYLEQQKVNSDCSGFFQFFIICIYELLLGIFQILKFDKRKMNLDRIRGAWAKLDPNRKYIDRAYVMVGRRPSATSEMHEAPPIDEGLQN